VEESRERIALSRRWRRCCVKMPSVMDRGLRFFRAFRLDKLDCFRANERTRTADLISLRVCGQWLLSIAEGCEFRISKRSLIPSIANYSRVLCPG